MPSRMNCASVLVVVCHWNARPEARGPPPMFDVRRRGKDLRLRRRHRRVLGDHRALRRRRTFDAERERVRPKAKYLLPRPSVLRPSAFARKDLRWMPAPSATTSSIDALMRLLAKRFLTASCIAGMRVWPPTGSTSAISGDLESRALRRGRRHRLLCQLNGPIDIFPNKVNELRARHLDLEVLRTVRVGRDIRDIDLRFHRGSKARASRAPAASFNR